ncbi:MAG: universal stress protein [Acidimicrobiia bacterium]|nr:universal stress protein [Acidimicrobiia bacterium]
MTEAWSARTIVVGVDGSSQSRHAATLAATLARAAGAKLHLMTVVRPPEGWWGIVGSPPTPTALSKTLTDAQREILDAVVSQVDLDGVDYETIEDIGDPARVLIDYCESVSADMLIVGKRGAGFIERLVLGSVANRLAHDAPCPLLLVP